MEEIRQGIPEVYAGRSIFVTGFSGFMGKMLVEKLIRSCSDVDTIYVLLRGKRSLTCQQRLEKILNSDAYVKCRENKMDILKKIIPFEGDVTLPALGLTDEQRSRLIDNVSIIFHCAASVKFDDPLPFAMDINVKGTKTIVDLALEMKKLDAFIHISTAYSNCDLHTIEEKLHPPHANWREALEIREKIDERLLNIFCEKYMNHMPNTYVFTKSLAEQMINDFSDRLPMVIFRPSIVVATWEEPFRGWIDNLNGPAGLSLGVATGVLRSIYVDTNIQPDFMPVDLAIKGLILAAYERIYKRNDGLHVYNWCSRKRSINYRQFIEASKKSSSQYPVKYMIWRPSFHTTTSFVIFYLNFLLFQVLPAFFLDLALRVVGREPQLLKIQRKIYNAMKALSPFTLNFFIFHNDKAENLENVISKKDLPNFGYLRTTHQKDVEDYLNASSRFFFKSFLKMDTESYKKARTLHRILTVLDVTVKTTFFTWLAFKIYTSNIIPTMFHATLNFLLKF